MNIFAVIGRGPNDLEIPLVMFPTKAEADEFKAQFPKHEKYDCFPDSFAEPRGEEGENEELYKKLFKDGRYYSGCGGCYSLRIREVEFGQPMVGWDLD